MAKLTKRQKLTHLLVVQDRSYSVDDAIKIIIGEYKAKCSAKFDETIEIAVKTGVNTDRNETVRGSVTLPHGNGKKVRVGVFAEGDDAKIAQSLGATILTVEEVKGGNVDFDACVATPDLMPKLASVARVLGPRGLMPNPKLGTVTKDIAKVVKELMAGRLDFRTDKQGNVNMGLGKISFTEQQLKENIQAFFASLKAVRPVTLKGMYVVSASLSSTMGPGFRLSIENVN